MYKIRLIILLCVLLGLTACSKYHYSYRPPSKPVYKPTPPVKVEPPPAKIQKPTPPTVKYAPARPVSPAVLALMSEAESETRDGNLDSAVVTIERALRIQPKNALLWHRLADLRLQQGKPRLALDLAKKSNTLVSGDQTLMQKNRRLIAESRRQLGETGGG